MQPDRSDTGAQIAAAALELLEREGVEAVTMRRVATAVGVTAMAIYRHFPGREALLQAVADAEFQTLANEFAGLRPRGNGSSRVVAFGLAYLDYALARPRIAEFLFWAPRSAARRYPDDFRARRSPTLTLLADAIAQAMKDGALRRDDAWEVAMTVWAHVHGFIALYLGGRIQLSPEGLRKLCEKSLKRLMTGIGAAR